jgi:hypothetical protein
MNNADELEQFKSIINLVEYAQAQGYSVIKSESSEKSKALRHSNGDKIIVATREDGHGVYFSVREDDDKGSIIDFAQRRKNLNLGQARKELRPWIGKGPEPERPAAPEPKPGRSSKDRQGVICAYAMAQACTRHPYLESRGLAPEILADPRFAGMIRVDPRGNAIFPHFDREGVSGYEIKNDGFTGFAKDGNKALWFSNGINRASRLVIAESAIDALSHAQLFYPDPDAGYISIGGAMSELQRELLRSMIAKASARGAEIVIATDADEVGDKYEALIRSMCPPGAVVRREVPEYGKDWNEQLQAPPGPEMEIDEPEQSQRWGLEM